MISSRPGSAVLQAAHINRRLPGKIESADFTLKQRNALAIYCRLEVQLAERDDFRRLILFHSAHLPLPYISRLVWP